MKTDFDRSVSREEFRPQSDDGTIICRCEEITKGEIRKAVFDGMRTMNEVKRYLRAGMGLCQGQTCGRLVRNIVARELGINPGELDIPTPRSPVRPLPMETYANDGVKK
jgi:NAD(P)H-nitrite reductase large subunit